MCICLMLFVVARNDKNYLNECTKVQNPRYKDVNLNAYSSAYEQKTQP